MSGELFALSRPSCWLTLFLDWRIDVGARRYCLVIVRYKASCTPGEGTLSLNWGSSFDIGYKSSSSLMNSLDKIDLR